MKKLLLAAATSALFLVACTDTKEEPKKEVKPATEQKEKVKEEVKEEVYKADVSDFRETGYRNSNGQILFWKNDKFTLLGTLTKDGKTTVLDAAFVKAGAKPEENFEKTYENAKYETKDNKYVITLEEGVVLEFEKIGPRTIKDSLGVTYTTATYPK